MNNKIPGYLDYLNAIGNPDKTLADPYLKKGKAPTKKSKGGRTVFETYTGQFALTIRFAVGTKEWAIRCFTHEIQPDFEERYRHVTHFVDEVRNDFLVGIEFQPKGILVEGVWYPICKMEWVEGETLGQYVENNLKQPRRMATLPENFLELAMELEELGCAHGDLQHGNIMVERKQLRLVDYDGMYLPSYTGQGLSAVETGHRNYQHPKRTPANFDPTIDRFSMISIYLSLRALQKDTSLYQQGGEALFLKQTDYLDPQNSLNIAKLGDLGYGDAAERLRQICEADIITVPTLRQFIYEDSTLLAELPEVLQNELEGEIVVRAVSNPPPAPEKPVSQPAAPIVVETSQPTKTQSISKPASNPAPSGNAFFSLPDDVVTTPPAPKVTPAAPAPVTNMSPTSLAPVQSVSKPVVTTGGSALFTALGDDDVTVTPPPPPAVTAPAAVPPPVVTAAPQPIGVTRAAPSSTVAPVVTSTTSAPPSMTFSGRIVRFVFVVIGALLGLLGRNFVMNSPLRILFSVEGISYFVDYVANLASDGILFPYLGLASMGLWLLYVILRHIDRKTERRNLLSGIAIVGFTLFLTIFAYSEIYLWNEPGYAIERALSRPFNLPFAILSIVIVLVNVRAPANFLRRIIYIFVAVGAVSLAFSALFNETIALGYMTLSIGIGVIPWLPDAWAERANKRAAISQSRTQGRSRFGQIARIALVLGLLGGGLIVFANGNNSSGRSERILRPTRVATTIPSSPTPMPIGNNTPRITNVTTSGTCENFTWNVTVTDSDSDVRSLARIDTNGNVTDTMNVSRGSGTYSWSNRQCTSNRCVGRFQAVDSRGNRSRSVEGTITCRQPASTATPVPTGNNRPSITSITSSGTCQALVWNVRVTDSDNDLVRLERLNNDGDVLSSLNISGRSGTYNWSDLSCSSGRCVDHIRAVDSRNNRSAVVDATITCAIATATPATRTGVVTGSQRINMRSGPGESYDVISGLDPRTSVTILETSSDNRWYKVRGGGRVGWVSRSLIRLS